jgi:hypothetical protein
MAVFVELGDDEVEPPQQGGKPIWRPQLEVRSGVLHEDSTQPLRQENKQDQQARGADSARHVDGDRNRLAEALSCYP